MKQDRFNEPDFRVISQTKFLNSDELKIAIESDDKAARFVAGYYDYDAGHFLLFRGNGMSVIVPSDFFKEHVEEFPDFAQFELVDEGRKIKLGRFEITSTSILRAMDPEFDKGAQDDITYRDGKTLLN